MADVSRRVKHDERERMTMLEFCELPKRKKESEKNHTNKTKKKIKWNKNKTEEEGRDLFFLLLFFSMKRKSRTWQSYERDSTLACSVLCV